MHEVPARLPAPNVTVRTGWIAVGPGVTPASGLTAWVSCPIERPRDPRERHLCLTIFPSHWRWRISGTLERDYTLPTAIQTRLNQFAVSPSCQDYFACGLGFPPDVRSFTPDNRRSGSALSGALEHSRPRVLPRQWPSSSNHSTPRWFPVTRCRPGQPNVLCERPTCSPQSPIA